MQAGPFVFISGQLPLDADRRVVGYTPGQQIKQCLKNALSVLDAAGGKLSDFVQVTIFVTDLEYWSEVNAAYAEFFVDVAVKPARAMVSVQEMSGGAKVAVHAIAYLESK